MNNKLFYNFIILSALFTSSLAFAAPEGGVVAAGTADISKSGNTTNINQTSSSAVINWHSFDTAGGEAVNFHQPDKNSVVLNRVNSGLPTNFAGILTANGKVFIVNPAGMVFAKGSQINTASFVATTADIKNQDFMDGNYRFLNDSAFDHAGIINNGTITAATHGVVALIAPTVSNVQPGIIQADVGTVELASGKSFVLDFNQDNLINFDISNLATSGSLENAGKITANGGRVVMSTDGVSQLFNNLMSMSGTIEATGTRVFQNGEVVLTTNKTGAVNISGKISSNRITVKAGKEITLSGKLETKSNLFYSDSISLKTDTKITETKTGGMQTNKLDTFASNGILLDSDSNNITLFSAVNTSTGDIYLKNNHADNFKLCRVYQIGGNLTVINNGNISQDIEIMNPGYLINVSGASTFITTGKNNSIDLSGKDRRFTIDFELNEYNGPVNLISEGNITIENSSFGNTVSFTTPGDVSVSSVGDVTLGDANVGGNFGLSSTILYTRPSSGTIIIDSLGSILQAPNTALNISGNASFYAYGKIIVKNPNNKISGEISLNNINKLSGPLWAFPIVFNNSIDTEISSAKASGILIITTNGKLNLNHWWAISSSAVKAPGGHSIILAASSLYYGGIYNINPGSDNSLLIYLPNPTAMSEDSYGLHVNNMTPIWGTSYTEGAIANIPQGNHFIYADKAPLEGDKG